MYDYEHCPHRLPCGMCRMTFATCMKMPMEITVDTVTTGTADPCTSSTTYKTDVPHTNTVGKESYTWVT